VTARPAIRNYPAATSKETTPSPTRTRTRVRFGAPGAGFGDTRAARGLQEQDSGIPGLPRGSRSGIRGYQGRQGAPGAGFRDTRAAKGLQEQDSGIPGLPGGSRSGIRGYRGCQGVPGRGAAGAPMVQQRQGPGARFESSNLPIDRG
jgi:hypothetical protein